MTIGLERGVVRLLPHAPEWAVLFAQEASHGPYVLDIQHVGSTAIPEIAAKPIIDIAVAVADFDQAQRCIAPIEELGYRYRGENGIPRRHYFVRGDPRAYHLHMLEQDSAEWRGQIAFRDYMRAHPKQAAAYDQIKRKLARRYPRDREAYTKAKGAFVLSIVALAQAEGGRP